MVLLLPESPGVESFVVPTGRAVPSSDLRNPDHRGPAPVHPSVRRQRRVWHHPVSRSTTSARHCYVPGARIIRWRIKSLRSKNVPIHKSIHGPRYEAFSWTGMRTRLFVTLSRTDEMRSFSFISPALERPAQYMRSSSGLRAS